MARTELDDCIIREGHTLRDALASLDRSGCQIVLVSDNTGRIVGLLTDGDIRRALLGGAVLESSVTPHAKRNFISVGPQTSRADVLDLMQSRRIGEVPILDGQGKPCGIHLMYDVLRRERRENWGLIMAGGKGKRLLPLTTSIPKPMLRVAGRPILERIVLHLVSAGVTEIFLAINYLGHIVEDHFGSGQQLGCRIHYLREKEALGTGGALSLLETLPEKPMLVMNGDLLTQADIGAMLDFHAKYGQVATVGVRRYLHNVPFGCLDLDGDRLTGIEEKPTLERTINAGIYVLDPKIIRRVPKGTEYAMPTLLSDALSRGEIVRAFEIEDDWIDVGQADQLRAARGEIK